MVPSAREVSGHWNVTHVPPTYPSTTRTRMNSRDIDRDFIPDRLLLRRRMPLQTQETGPPPSRALR